ncbi:MAG: ATP-dependent Clp protease ATP-binding subunit [Clostridia bacterium]|nr:ATP-dependent Clp protease ATP-binding subunit [Clostridia bacterium]
MTNKFTQKAQSSLSRSMQLAEELGHTYIGSEHLLLALATEEGSISHSLLSSKGANEEALRAKIMTLMPKGSPSTLCAADMTPRLRQIIEASATVAEKNRAAQIGTEHLLSALIEHKESVASRILSLCEVPQSELRAELAAYLVSREKSKLADSKEKGEKASKIAGAPTLSLYGKDLSAQCAKGKLDPIIGRDKETEHVIRILSRRTKNNPCLIGEPGVGKTAVIEGLAERIYREDVPETLLGKRIIMLDVSAMLAGAKYRGEFEERMKRVMGEITENPDIIIFIDEIHTIVGAGAAEGAVDAANIIKPALARAELQIIGATTLAEYRTHIEKDAALERRFQPVLVSEPTEDETIEILKGLRPRYEAHHALKISDEAISCAVKLSKRYIPDRYLPDKAIDLIDEAASGLRISGACAPTQKRDITALRESIKREKEAAVLREDFEAAKRLRAKELELVSEEAESTKDKTVACVTADDIAKIVTAWTGIPISKILEEEAKTLANLEAKLKEVIIGQDDAITAVSAAIKRGRVGLKDAARPIGSFLFVGRTGVGKTQLARTLARIMFGERQPLIRFDMAEYMEKHSVSKLIGSPPGYVGYGEGGQLTEKVRRHPYSVVLFDEIEKAHPDIFNVLLSILEDGSVTDSTGRRIDFRNTVIIMTSNIASSKARHRSLGFSSKETSASRESIISDLEGVLSPEFLNRIDEIVLFEPLREKEIEIIAAKMLDELVIRAKSIGIELNFSPTVATHLANTAYSDTFGARSIRREIIQRIENKISSLIIEGSISSSDSLLVDVADDKMLFIKNSVCML